MAIEPPWCMVRSISRKAAGLPDISRPTSKPSCMLRSFMVSSNDSRCDIHRARGPQLAREVESIVVYVRDDHIARADETSDRDGHDADRAAPVINTSSPTMLNARAV